MTIFIGYRFLKNGLDPVDRASEEVIEIEIPLGSNRNAIGTILEENDLINSPLVYTLYTRLNDEKKFQAGTYQMSQSMSLEEIVTYLNEGGTPITSAPIARVAIPEGIHLEEIANRFEESTDFTKENFMDLVQESIFIEAMVEKYPDLLTDAMEAAPQTRYTLEGYLYPATYEVYEETTMEEIVDEMLGQMNKVMSPYYEEIQAGNLNVHEILTLASYIEGEGVSDEDRALIAGVFYNRLNIDMLLRTDPSVSYALGEHRERITYADLEIDSPYNTYKYKGIGAGPINSPSVSAIKASLNPAETDYLFFLADLETGNVYFSETYEEHLELKSKYLDNK